MYTYTGQVPNQSTSKYKHLTLPSVLSSIVLGLGPTLMYFSVQYYNYLLRSVGPIIKVEYEEVKV